MKYIIQTIFILILLNSCNHNQGHGHGHHGPALEASDFKSEKISKTANITLNGNIETVFPLFNPIEEQKWAPVFKPQFIYPTDETVQEGMSFKTAGQGSESEYLWIITKYDTTENQIQYLVSTDNRYWTITIICKTAPDNNDQTSANITYTYYALNNDGVKMNKSHLKKMYSNNLEDWESAINAYLKQS